MVLIGESDARAGDMLERLYARRLRERPAVPPHEPRQRRADEDRGEHLRHDEDLLREHAGGHLRALARRGRRAS